MSETKKDTPEQQEFRAYCHDWLAANNPLAPEFRMPKYRDANRCVNMRGFSGII